MSEANKLLMMFIKDTYKTASGKPSKKTAMALINFVASEKGLQEVINGGDNAEILNFKIETK